MSSGKKVIRSCELLITICHITAMTKVVTQKLHSLRKIDFNIFLVSLGHLMRNKIILHRIMTDFPT